MSDSGKTHLFWGSFSPLGGLFGMGLLVMASGRLAWALSVSAALLWVYGFSVLAAFPGSCAGGSPGNFGGSPGSPGAAKTVARFFPQRGKQVFFVFLASFIGGLYLLLFWFVSPLAALEAFFPICLVPLFCAGSGVFERVQSLDLGGAILRAVSEALVMAGLLLALSLIREPLGFCSLTLPGGPQGTIPLFVFEGGSFLPVRIIAGSSGALLVLGYGTAVYRYFRSSYALREEDQ
jgi:hypothetical protein